MPPPPKALFHFECHLAMQFTTIFIKSLFTDTNQAPTRRTTRGTTGIVMPLARSWIARTGEWPLNHTKKWSIQTASLRDLKQRFFTFTDEYIYLTARSSSRASLSAPLRRPTRSACPPR